VTEDLQIIIEITVANADKGLYVTERVYSSAALKLAGLGDAIAKSNSAMHGAAVTLLGES